MNALVCFFLTLFVMQVVDFFFYSISKGSNETEQHDSDNINIGKSQFRGVYYSQVYDSNALKIGGVKIPSSSVSSTVEDNGSTGSRAVANTDGGKAGNSNAQQSLAIANPFYASLADSRFAEQFRAIRQSSGEVRVEVFYRKSLLPEVQAVEIRISFHHVRGSNIPPDHLKLQGVIVGGRVDSENTSDKEYQRVDPRFGPNKDDRAFYSGTSNPTYFQLFSHRPQPRSIVNFLTKLVKKADPNAEKEKKEAIELHCPVKFRIFRDDNSQNQGPDKNWLRTAFLESHECHGIAKMVLREVQSADANRKVWNYAFMLNIASVMEMVLWGQQLTASNGVHHVSLFQIFVLALHTMLDIFMMLVFAARELPANTNIFNTFSIAMFLKFVLFASMQTRYITKIWRQRRPDSGINDPVAEEHQLRREVTALYWKFYLVLLAGIYMVFLTIDNYHHWLVMGLSFIWVPQILIDIHFGYRTSLEWKFCRGVSALRALPLLYMYGCPYNIFNGDIHPHLSGNLRSSTDQASDIGNWSTFNEENRHSWVPIAADGESQVLASLSSLNYYVVFVVVLIYGLQLGIIFTQRKWGARWFVPWACLPHVYKYSKAPPTDALVPESIGRSFDMHDLEDPPITTGGQKYDCIICMTELDWKATSEEQPVCAPCNHWFHKKCLETWMDVKMECPTCRTHLPPLEV